MKLTFFWITVLILLGILIISNREEIKTTLLEWREKIKQDGFGFFIMLELIEVVDSFYQVSEKIEQKILWRNYQEEELYKVYPIEKDTMIPYWNKPRDFKDELKSKPLYVMPETKLRASYKNDKSYWKVYVINGENIECVYIESNRLDCKGLETQKIR